MNNVQFGVQPVEHCHYPWCSDDHEDRCLDSADWIERHEKGESTMKKYLNISFVYAIAAMAGGVFYREFTRFNGYTRRASGVGGDPVHGGQRFYFRDRGDRSYSDRRRNHFAAAVPQKAGRELRPESCF